MALTISIKGGSTREDHDLCLSCTNAYIRTDTGGETRMCRAPYESVIPIPHKVSKCSCYDLEFTQSIYQLEQSAWILQTDKQHVGFKRWREILEDERGTTPDILL